MWRVIKFKTLEQCNKWVELNGHKYQYVQVFIANVPFALEVKRLRVIG